MTCSVQHCDNKAIKRGWCNKHYQRWRTGRGFERSNRDPNEIVIIGDVAKVALYGSSLSNHRINSYALIDVADIVLVKNYKWHLDSGYASAHISTGKLYIHRLIVQTSLEIDHKNGNKLDNRRFNLRPATRAQNLSNVPARVHNTSGHKNIMFDSRQGRGWYVQISFGGKRYFRGYYYTIEKALEIRNRLLLQVHGEFTRKG